VGSERQLTLAAGQGPFAEIIRAIDDEIEAIERGAGGSIDVSEGRRLHRGIDGSLYTFRGELDTPLPPETPIALHASGSRHRGVLVAVDDFDVLVQLREDAGERVGSATISSEPAFILDKLRERLTGLAAEDPRALAAGPAGALVQADLGFAGFAWDEAEEAGGELARLEDPGLTPNHAQMRAMACAAGSNLHFVWGPPGTGKTANLAQIARMLVGIGERVLILSHANVAVDVAMMRVADAFRDRAELAQGRVLRVGEPRHPEALGREEILVIGAVRRRHPELAARREQLEERRRALGAALRREEDETERDVLAAELRRVRDALRSARAEHEAAAARLVADAALVGATLSRLALSDLLWNWRPDAILLDEASMVSFPWVLAAATRVQKRLVVLGDFRQLPPVHVTRSEVGRRWLGRDAFDVAGVRARIDAGEDDERVTLLDTQYRMAESIATAVSELAYAGRVRTDPGAAARAEVLAEAEPWPGSPLVVVDTSALAPACLTEDRLDSFSRLNPLHLLLALSLAGRGSESGSLISPYRAQARLLAAGTRDLALPGTTAATIHRFQGSERDAVVFDLVDAPPIDGPSRLTGSDVDLALRLTNVGLSRAKGKAILLVNRELVDSRYAPGAPVRRAVELCVDRGKFVQPSPPDVLDLSRGELRWFDGWDGVAAHVEGEVERARRSIVANVPDGVDVPQPLTDALVRAAGRGVRVALRGPLDMLAPLEETSAQLALLAGPSFLLSIERAAAYVGGRTVGAVARVAGPTLVPLLEAMLVGDDRTTAELPPAQRALPWPG
jgi:hypothetical protein